MTKKKMPTSMQIVGKPFDVEFKSLRKKDGWCIDGRRTDKGKIIYEKRMKGKRQLEVFIHEMLHGSAHHVLDEDFVDRLAKDITNFLWKVGYRMPSKE